MASPQYGYLHDADRPESRAATVASMAAEKAGLSSIGGASMSTDSGSHEAATVSHHLLHDEVRESVRSRCDIVACASAVSCDPIASQASSAGVRISCSSHEARSTHHVFHLTCT